MLPRRVQFRRLLALLAAAASLHVGHALVPPLCAQAPQDTAAAPDTSTAAAPAPAPAPPSAPDTAAGDTATTDTAAADTAAAPPGGRAGMPLWVPVLFLGLVAAAVVGLVLGSRQDWEAWLMWLLFAVGILSLFAAGVTGGIWWAGRAAARAGPAAVPAPVVPGLGLLQFLLLGVAVVSLVFLVLFAVESRRHAVALESHWGGFGGGLGGIRVPASGLYLLVALGFGAMLTILSLQYMEKLAGLAAKDAGKAGAEQADTTARRSAVRPAAAAPDSAAAAADTSQP